MRSRGFEPLVCRVPTVPDERLCTRHVLAMEYLPGCSLASAVESELADIAAALGMDSRELRLSLMRRVHAHFKDGGGKAQLLGAAELAAPLLRGYAAAVRRLRHAIGTIHAEIVRYAALVGVHLSPALVPPKPAVRHDISRVIRTLCHVHGCAMLLDGVYNADPHPGNVLLLPDGRLGLIDYGMVGRLAHAERESIAKVC